MRIRPLLQKLLGIIVVEGSARNLALFRILVFGGLVLTTTDPSNDLAWLLTIPPELRSGTTAVAQWWFAFGPGTARAIQSVCIVASALACVGFLTPVTIWLATLTGIYALGLPNLFGKVVHHHHLVWFAILLCCGGSAEALSVDAWIRRRKGLDPRPGPSIRYGIPLQAALLVIGLAYFSSGIWKLLAGKMWLFGGNLRFILNDYWLTNHYIPFFRPDSHPALMALLPTAVVAFELSFIFLIAFRATRIFGILLACLFHLSMAVFIKIPFLTLSVIYLAYLNQYRSHAGFVPSIPKNWSDGRGAMLACTLLLIGNMNASARGIDGIFFTTYPRFSHLQGPTRWSLVLKQRTDNGPFSQLNTAHFVGKFRLARWDVLQRRIAAASPSEATMLAGALIRIFSRNGWLEKGVVEVCVDKCQLFVSPDQWERNPVSVESVACISADQF